MDGGVALGPTVPDVVYLVAPSVRNEELRYSLRSLKNLPHGRVWIAGGAPRWIHPAGVFETRRRGTRYQHTAESLLAAASSPDVAETFVVMNDDFFITQQIDAVPTAHRGLLSSVQLRSLGDVFGPEPLSYELHIPMVMTKAGVLEIFELAIKPPVLALLKRTIYGNHFAIGGEEWADVKIQTKRQPWSDDRGFLSTNDPVFAQGSVGGYLRGLFPHPSPYEEAS